MSKEEYPMEIGWKKELLEEEKPQKEEQPSSCPSSRGRGQKYHRLSSGSSRSSSSDNSTSSSSGPNDNEDKHRKRKDEKRDKKEKYKMDKLLKKEKKKLEKAERREIKKAKKEKRREEKRFKKLTKKDKDVKNKEEDFGIPIDLMYTKAKAPETKEEYEARQKQIRKVVDPITGRTRLIKGDGEILEEIVSREQHQEINKRATQEDGDYFQSKTIGWKSP